MRIVATSQRYVERVEQDIQRMALLRLLTILRSEGWLWSQLTLALADAIDGIRTEPIHHAMADYAGPWRLWEKVHIAIADVWQLERVRAREMKEDERLARH